MINPFSPSDTPVRIQSYRSSPRGVAATGKQDRTGSRPFFKFTELEKIGSWLVTGGILAGGGVVMALFSHNSNLPEFTAQLGILLGTGTFFLGVMCIRDALCRIEEYQTNEICNLRRHKASIRYWKVRCGDWAEAAEGRFCPAGPAGSGKKMMPLPAEIINLQNYLRRD